MRQMQKAMAIIQFKLESQAIVRNPDFISSIAIFFILSILRSGRCRSTANAMRCLTGISHHRLERSVCALVGGGRVHGAIAHSFLQSQTLRDQMRYVERKGTMYLLRDYNLIFHRRAPV